MTTKKAIFAALAIPVISAFAVLHINKQPLNRFNEASANIEITTSSTTEKANKVKVLTKFFEKYKSPLSAHSTTFVEIADKYNMDYRLLPAISCVESACGKLLIKSSHNPFGWGIYGNKVTSFSSYDEAIFKVGEGISKNYISRGFDTPERMGRIYNPNTPKEWAGRTRGFMNQMDEIAYNEVASNEIGNK